jgi:hypothetical protein
MANYGGLSATYHLNRLAGTIKNGVPQLDYDGAAIQWATNVIPGHNQSRAIGALNAIYASRNGGKNYYYDTPGVLNALAGTYGIGEAEAAARIVS